MSRAALLVALLASCASPAPRTQIMVRFEADDGIREDARSIRLVLASPGFTATPMTEVTPGGWPYEAAIVPRDEDATRTFSLRAEAVDATGSTVLGTVSARSGFVAGRTLLLTLRFDDACRGTPGCPTDQSCSAGECASDLHPPDGLPDYTPPGGGVDGGVDGGPPTDATADAGTDATTDGGADAGSGFDFAAPVSSVLTGCREPRGIAQLDDSRFVVACTRSDFVAVLSPGAGMGALEIARSASVTAPRTVVVANVEGTAEPEIVVPVPTTEGLQIRDADLAYLRGFGVAGMTERAVVAGELTGDAFAELVVGTGGGIAVLTGGMGGLTGTGPALTSNGAVSFALARVGTDALTDLYVVDGRSDRMRLDVHPGIATSALLGDISGEGHHPASGTYAQYVLAADLTGDGRDEAIVLFGFDRATGGPGRLLVVSPTTAPEHTVVLDEPLGAWPGIPCLGDFNGDDRLDLAVPHEGIDGSSYPIQIFLGDGTSLARSVTLRVPDPARVALCADVDGNGRLDLLVTHGGTSTNGSVSVFSPR